MRLSHGRSTSHQSEVGVAERGASWLVTALVARSMRYRSCCSFPARPCRRQWRGRRGPTRSLSARRAAPRRDSPAGRPACAGPARTAPCGRSGPNRTPPGRRPTRPWAGRRMADGRASPGQCATRASRAPSWGLVVGLWQVAGDVLEQLLLVTGYDQAEIIDARGWWLSRDCACGTWRCTWRPTTNGTVWPTGRRSQNLSRQVRSPGSKGNSTVAR